VSLWDWIDNTGERLRNEGIRGLGESASLLYHGSWRITGSRLPIGTNVYDRDWDALIILDGCRVDLAESVAEEYSFIDQVDSLTSVASTSREWLAKTFAAEFADEIAETAYVSANPHTDEILGNDSTADTRSPFNPMNWDSAAVEDFLAVDEVWDDGWDSDLGTVPPRTVTNRAIHTGRSLSPDRLIVHYMQPHQPFIGAIENKDTSAWRDGNVWNVLRRSEVSRDELWAAYRDTLIAVLDEVELLLDNADADKVVITSDHGNALGEWGIYGHPNGCLHPAVKRVPWIETTAIDSGDHDPEIELGGDEADVSERLKNLGYL